MDFFFYNDGGFLKMVYIHVDICKKKKRKSSQNFIISQHEAYDFKGCFGVGLARGRREGGVLFL